MKISVILFFLVLSYSCFNDNDEDSLYSEWRDPKTKESGLIINTSSLCDKLIGDWKSKRILQKNFENDEDLFLGIQALNKFIITDSLIYNFSIDDTLMDAGKCNCKEGTLAVNWERQNKRVDYFIHFNSEKEVELRYFSRKMMLDTDNLEYRTKIIMSQAEYADDLLEMAEKQYHDSLHIQRNSLSWKKLNR